MVNANAQLRATLSKISTQRAFRVRHVLLAHSKVHFPYQFMNVSLVRVKERSTTRMLEKVRLGSVYAISRETSNRRVTFAIRKLSSEML